MNAKELASDMKLNNRFLKNIYKHISDLRKEEKKAVESNSRIVEWGCILYGERYKKIQHALDHSDYYAAFKFIDNIDQIKNSIIGLIKTCIERREKYLDVKNMVGFIDFLNQRGIY